MKRHHVGLITQSPWFDSRLRYKGGDTLRILILGDLHYPYQSKAAVKWAIKLAYKLKPDIIVQVGDLYDQFSFSRYPKSAKLTPETEIALAREEAADLWDRLPKNCARIQMVGNHDERILKKALAVAPELAFLVGRSLRELYTFPDVRTVQNYEHVINGIMFQHGHRAKLGDHAKYNQMSTVCGHSHVGGVVFMRNRLGLYYELNAGFLGDVNTEAFSYQSQKVINNCTLGVGYIDENGPRFIPYPGH